MDCALIANRGFLLQLPLKVSLMLSSYLNFKEGVHRPGLSGDADKVGGEPAEDEQAGGIQAGLDLANNTVPSGRRTAYWTGGHRLTTHA